MLLQNKTNVPCQTSHQKRHLLFAGYIQVTAALVSSTKWNNRPESAAKCLRAEAMTISLFAIFLAKMILWFESKAVENDKVAFLSLLTNTSLQGDLSLYWGKCSASHFTVGRGELARLEMVFYAQTVYLPALHSQMPPPN